MTATLSQEDSRVVGQVQPSLIRRAKPVPKPLGASVSSSVKGGVTALHYSPDCLGERIQCFEGGRR